jgi:hypothetical protein
MIRRRATVGLALLCALLFSAFAAPSASAVKGTTIFTCAPVAEKGAFRDAHCKEAGPSSPGFNHVAIEQGLTTNFHATNETTPLVLEGKTGGIAVKISCAKVLVHGSLTNNLDTEAKEHFVHGTEITVRNTECKVTGPKECKIPGEEIEITSVTATTTGKGDNVTFVPSVGNQFVAFSFEGCSVKELNTEYKVLGSVTAQPSGATLNFTHKPITETKELTFGGQPAGLAGTITLRQADAAEECGKTNNAISLTTVET